MLKEIKVSRPSGWFLNFIALDKIYQDLAGGLCYFITLVIGVLCEYFNASSRPYIKFPRSHLEQEVGGLNRPRCFWTGLITLSLLLLHPASVCLLSAKSARSSSVCFGFSKVGETQGHLDLDGTLENGCRPRRGNRTEWVSFFIFYFFSSF